MTKKPKRPSVGERIAAKVDVEWGYSGQVREDVARRIDAAIRRAVRKRDAQWIAVMARWSHVQPTIESHRMIVKTMSQQERSTP